MKEIVKYNDKPEMCLADALLNPINIKDNIVLKSYPRYQIDIYREMRYFFLDNPSLLNQMVYSLRNFRNDVNGRSQSRNELMMNYLSQTYSIKVDCQSVKLNEDQAKTATNHSFQVPQKQLQQALLNDISSHLYGFCYLYKRLTFVGNEVTMKLHAQAYAITIPAIWAVTGQSATKCVVWDLYRDVTTERMYNVTYNQKTFVQFADYMETNHEITLFNRSKMHHNEAKTV